MTASELITKLDLPCWDDCREQLDALLSRGFPSAESLNPWLPPGLRNQNGRPLRFVSSQTLPAVEYERHIFEQGQISTRPDNWHDLFNALAWMQFPAIKSALNARHYAATDTPGPVGRGRQRDALTLFDECGVIVICTGSKPLLAIANHDWNEVFKSGIARWAARYRVLLIGHAMREKLLRPYKAMTANALLVEVTEEMFQAPLAKLHGQIDSKLAALLGSGSLLQSPQELAPLPLMGIPGWWSCSEQDAAFYADQHVFRTRAARRKPGGVVHLNAPPDVALAL